jgi:hypothetical protein
MSDELRAFAERLDYWYYNVASEEEQKMMDGLLKQIIHACDEHKKEIAEHEQFIEERKKALTEEMNLLFLGFRRQTKSLA